MQGGAPILKNMAFVLISLGTLLGGLESYFNFRALWVEYEQTKAEFHTLQDDLAYYRAGVTPDNLSRDKLDEFQVRYQEIWHRFNKTKLEHRQSNRFNV